MPKEFVGTGPLQGMLREYEEPALAPDEVRIKTVLSNIKHGTEMAFFRGTAPHATKYFNRELNLFLPKPPPSPDTPKRPGGAMGTGCVGKVIEVGREVKDMEVGELVAAPGGHRETHVAKRSVLIPLRGNLTVDQASELYLGHASVALNAVHDAQIKLGDQVAVTGLGHIGLITVQLAKLNGAEEVYATDLSAKRRDLASKTGANLALDPATVDAPYEIKKQTGGGVDVAIEASGTYPGLQDAIRSVKKFGTIIALGFYQGGGTALRLGEEFHHNRVNLLSSQSGGWGNVPRHYPHWDSDRVMKTVYNLLVSGRLKTDGFISHRFPFEKTMDAYRMIDQNPMETIRVAITYS